MARLIAIFMMTARANLFFPWKFSPKGIQRTDILYVLTTILCALCAVYPLALRICTVTSSPFGTSADIRKSLALRIMYYSTWPMPAVTNMLLRLLAMTELGAVMELVSFLTSQWALSKSRSYAKSYGALLALFIPSAIALHSWILWQESGFTMAICSWPQHGGRFIRVIAAHQENLAHIVGLAFIIIFGLKLVQSHEGLCDILRVQFYESNPAEYEELRKAEQELGMESSYPRLDWLPGFHCPQGLRHRGAKGKLDPIFSVSAPKKAGLLAYDEFSKEFKALKDAFRRYEEAAGMFAIVLILGSAAGIVEHVGHLAFGLEERETSVVLLLEKLFYLFMVAHFGEFISAKVEENREELRDAVGQFGWDGESELERLSDWVVAWEWRLSAKDVFFINHRVVPAIFGTVMTFFIFIFQLRMSEMEDARELATAVNTTTCP